MMNISEFSEKALVFSSEHTVSRVASAMLSKGRHEAAIIDGNEIRGAVFTRDLAKRSITQPDKSKIRGFVVGMKIVRDADPSMILRSALDNDHKSVLVGDPRSPRFITKLGMLGMALRMPGLSGKKVIDVMSPPYCISKSDSIATASSVLKETGVSRLPVVNKEGKMEGMLDSLDMLKSDLKKKRMSSGDEVGEKRRQDRSSISNIMGNSYIEAARDDDIKDVVGRMISSGTTTAMVVSEGRPIGIVTPKSIIRLVVGKPETFHIRINGLEHEGEYMKSLVQEEATASAIRMGKRVRLHYMAIHVSSKRKTGRKSLYTAKARAFTSKGMFFADDDNWDLTVACSEALRKLKRELDTKIGRSRARSKPRAA